MAAIAAFSASVSWASCSQTARSSVSRFSRSSTRLAGAGLVFGLSCAQHGGVLAFGDLPLERLDLLLKRTRRIDRLRRRDERAGIEIRLLAVGPVEPDAELAGELERGQRVCMGALGLVDGGVSELAQRVEEVGDLSREDPFVGQPAERLLEGLPLVEVGGMVGGDQFGQQFGELPELDDGVEGSSRKYRSARPPSEVPDAGRELPER